MFSNLYAVGDFKMLKTGRVVLFFSYFMSETPYFYFGGVVIVQFKKRGSVRASNVGTL